MYRWPRCLRNLASVGNFAVPFVKVSIASRTDPTATRRRPSQMIASALSGDFA
jgi:hypothetical protein